MAEDLTAVNVGSRDRQVPSRHCPSVGLVFMHPPSIGLELNSRMELLKQYKRATVSKHCSYR